MPRAALGVRRTETGGGRAPAVRTPRTRAAPARTQPQEPPPSPVSTDPALFAELADNALVGLYLIQDGLFAYVNASFERMLRCESGELTGTDPLAIVHPDDRSLVAENIRRRMAGQPADGPLLLRLLGKDGETRHVEVLGAAVDLQGRRAVFGAALDVTERVRAQKALRASEEHYEFVAGHIDDVLWRVDLKSQRFIYVSPAVERLRGYTPAEVMAAPMADALTPESARLLEAHLRDHLAAVRAGTTLPAPVRLRVEQPTKDGGTVATEVATTLLLDQDGEPSELVGVTRSLVERERADRALRESEARFRTLIDKAPVAIGVGRAGMTVAVNDAYLSLFGFESDTDLIGHSLGEQIAPGSWPEVLELSKRRAQGLDAPTLYETRGRRSDGSEFSMHVAATQVELPDGPATVAFLTDLTTLRQAEADLAFEARVESALFDALHGLPPHATAEEAAEALCEAMWTLPSVRFSAVFGFGPSDQVTALAHRAPEGFPPAPSADARTRQLHEAAGRGPHAEYWQPSPDAGTWEAALTRIGLQAAAYAPIVHGDHVDGLLMIGTCDREFARMFVERLPAVVDFSAMSSALLAERLHARREEIEARAKLASVLEDGAFEIVFQPIVDLASGDTVGHEALTRFTSGERPDLCFADAWRVGLGPELEEATLKRAVEAARALPSGLWLDLNLSPRLLAAADRLRGILSHADRPLVLEVTEHEAIDDYSATRDGLHGVAPGARIAVDDAGAGIANFAHIVELRPDFVKLDIGLVRRVNLDLGRQALVIGMRHFAQTAGCRLIAEGVETKGEAETLLSLGVEYGQGWYFGKAEPA